MKRYSLLLALLLPLTSVAQVNDIYFVPTKEKKTVVVKSSEVNSFADIDNNYTTEEEFAVDTLEADVVYYTNDLYDLYYGDYDYSTRIVRFRSPGRLMGSSLYWDLRYNSGINDWLIYDNGYTIDIYPTANNPFYYGGCGLGYYNPSAWHVHFNLFTPYWAWTPSWYWHDFHWHNHHWYSSHWYNHHWHNHHWHNHHWHRPHWYAGYYPTHNGHGSLRRPGHVVHTNVPAKGDRGGNVRNANTVNKANDRGGTPTARSERPRRTVNDANVTNSAAPSRDNRGGTLQSRSERPRREVNSTDVQNNATRTEKTTGINRQQPQRGTTNTNVRENQNNRGGSAERTYNSNSSSTRSNSTYRSSSSNSSSRSGSTSVSRSSSSSRSSSGSSRSFSSGSTSRGGSSSSSRSGSSRR